MEMNYHKIRNVPLEVCTAEQKIAYNLAWDLYINFDFDKKLSIAPTGWCKSELIFQAKDYCVKRIKRTEKWQKFDIDAILSAWMLGIEDYMLNTNKILTSYEEVGRVFPAAYLNQI